MTAIQLNKLGGREGRIIRLLLNAPYLTSDNIWNCLRNEEPTLTKKALRTMLTRMKDKGLVRQVVFNKWTADYKPLIGHMFDGIHSVGSLLVSVMDVAEWDKTSIHLERETYDWDIVTIVEKKHIDSCFELWTSDLDDEKRALMEDIPQMVWEFLSLPYFGFRYRDHL